MFAAEMQHYPTVLRLSHDFLHRTLIVITMIYRRRYGWHKDIFILLKRFDISMQRSTTVQIPQQYYLTDEGVDRRNVWEE